MGKFDNDEINNEMKGRNLPLKGGAAFPLDDETTPKSIRFHKSRVEALQRYFKNQGVDLSTGVRQVLYKWMDEQGIR